MIFAALTQCRMDKISSSVSPVKKGQLRRTGRYCCIKALLVGIQTYKLPLVYYFDMGEIAWNHAGTQLAYTCKPLTGAQYAQSTDSDIFVYDLASCLLYPSRCV